MCRYSDHDYPQHFLCLPCKKSFKGDFDSSVDRRCPGCGALAIRVGRDFKAPRKTASTQWRKIAVLLASGVSFDSCGCGDHSFSPKTLAQALHNKTIFERFKKSREHATTLEGAAERDRLHTYIGDPFLRR